MNRMRFIGKDTLLEDVNSTKKKIDKTFVRRMIEIASQKEGFVCFSRPLGQKSFLPISFIIDIQSFPEEQRLLVKKFIVLIRLCLGDAVETNVEFTDDDVKCSYYLV